MMNLYVSLDEARAELHKRWQDEELKKANELPRRKQRGIKDILEV